MGRMRITRWKLQVTLLISGSALIASASSRPVRELRDVARSTIKSNTSVSGQSRTRPHHPALPPASAVEGWQIRAVNPASDWFSR